MPLSPVADDPCPCGWGRAFGGCCRRLLIGERQASTAEALMRSRYTAFAVGDEAYVRRTWHPDHRPDVVRLDADRDWVGLRVLATTGGGVFDQEVTVEFEAQHVQRGREGRLHEVSQFVRHDGRWVYTVGTSRRP